MLSSKNTVARRFARARRTTEDRGLSLECARWSAVPDVQNAFQMFWPRFRWTSCTALRRLSCSGGGLDVLLKHLSRGPVLALFGYSFVPVRARAYVCETLAGEAARCLRCLEQTCLGAGAVREVQHSGSWGSFIRVELQARHSLKPSTLEAAVFNFNLPTGCQKQKRPNNCTLEIILMTRSNRLW